VRWLASSEVDRVGNQIGGAAAGGGRERTGVVAAMRVGCTSRV
jgi:hypothetical protein